MVCSTSMAVQTFICLDCGKDFSERTCDRTRIDPARKKRLVPRAICRACSRTALEKFWRDRGSSTLLAGLLPTDGDRKRLSNRRYYQRNLHHETREAGEARELASNARR